MNHSLPPELSAQFHIERTLKQSERGRVLLVRHKDTGSRAICKQFHGDGAVCRLLMGVCCPNLPRMELVREADGLVTTLEEYIQGDTLAFLLAAGSLTPKQSKEIMLQLCRGLSVLHDLGIIHRDIKPENVILRGDTAVLIDFDAARVEKNTGSHDTVLMGTAGYAAPEQYGFAQTDARSDIYSMGVLLNIMLTGQHPAAQLTDGCYAEVIQRCIEVNADRRYQSAAELAKALDTARSSKKQPHPALLLWILPLILLLAALTPFPMDSTEAPERIGPAAFTYDLDQDGIEEDYLFGVTFSKPGALTRKIIYHDRIGLDNESQTPTRTALVCVWGQNRQGTWELHPEMCRLLTDAAVTVHKAEDPHAVPKITPSAPRQQGAIFVEFTPDPLGTWVYTATAELDGLKLTGSASTRIVPEN